jgi:hypothetical protein
MSAAEHGEGREQIRERWSEKGDGDDRGARVPNLFVLAMDRLTGNLSRCDSATPRIKIDYSVAKNYFAATYLVGAAACRSFFQIGVIRFRSIDRPAVT